MQLVYRSLVAVFAIGTTAVMAQEPPYDVFPAAEPPYYRIPYEA